MNNPQLHLYSKICFPGGGEGQWAPSSGIYWACEDIHGAMFTRHRKFLREWVERERGMGISRAHTSSAFTWGAVYKIESFWDWRRSEKGGKRGQVCLCSPLPFTHLSNLLGIPVSSIFKIQSCTAELCLWQWLHKVIIELKNSYCLMS